MPGLGSLTVYLNANSTGLERGLAQASSMLKKFAAASAGFLAVNSLKNLAEESLALAGAQEKAENLMTRTLQNTAGMADTTVAELKRYAAETQKITIFGDEKVMEAQTRLMQMNSVTGNAFRQTRAVALDIASATGQDLTAVMQTLGKAMQDPVKGLRQLREYGVDPAMKDSIEQIIAAQGKEAAQLTLLANLQQRYAGAAEEAANTISGAFAQNRNAIGDLKEGIGFVINEIFDVRGALVQSGNWFGSWAQYLRDHAAEIGYGFKSVWNDIQYGAMRLYAFVAPVINQIASLTEAAVRNLVQFYQAIQKLLNGEDFQMQFYQPVMTMFDEYKKIWDTWDQLDRAQSQAQDNLTRGFKLQLDQQAEQNIARGAEEGAAEGTLKGIKQSSKQKFDSPSAIMGSLDAWKIIASAAAFKSAPQASAESAAQAGTTEPAAKYPQSEPAAKYPQSEPAAGNKPAASVPIRTNPFPSVQTPALFKTSVTSESLRLTPEDTWQSIKDMYALLNPGRLAAELVKTAVTAPEKFSSAYKIATAPQAQNEDWFTRGLMGITSISDSKNNGVKGDPARFSSAITRQEVDAARAEREKKIAENSQKQLTVLEKINASIKSTAATAANLVGW